MEELLQPATFGQRLTAFMLDLFIVAIPAFVFTLTFATPFLFSIEAIKDTPNKDFEIIYQFYKNGVYISLTACAFISAVLAFFAISKWQATPGKRIVNIYIARQNGAAISFWDAFGRFISLPLFILMLQIFERRENYAVMDNLKANNTSDLSLLENHLNGPVTQTTNAVVLAVITFWFIRIFFSPDKTALHDVLFNTRVLKGKLNTNLKA